MNDIIKIKSICDNIRKLPKVLIDIICNDYLQHDHIMLMYKTDILLLMQTINRFYHIYTRSGNLICGENGSIVYNTDRIGLYYAVIVNNVFFHQFPCMLLNTILHISRVDSITVGDKILFSNGRKKYAHIITSVHETYYRTNTFRISKYSLTRRVLNKNPMTVTKEFLHGMNYVYINL